MSEAALPRAGDLQAQIDHVLNEPDTLAGRIVELTIGCLILLASGAYVLESELVGTPYAYWVAPLQTFERAIMVIFVGEYLLRWWARRWSLRYVVSPLAIVDLIAIMPLLISSQLHFVRVLRMFRVLRMLRLVESRKFFFGEVTEDHRRVLRIMLTIFCLVFITGGLVYECEKHHNPEFQRLSDAIYFATVTLTTVGFGDLAPITLQGRLVTMAMILTGVMIIPWQLTNLARYMLETANKIQTTCAACGLRFHDADASHCKACGQLIYQEFDGS